ncbi:N-acetylglutamate synthase-like GNAT family acetyltransferase [Murinocardiopsis flavida]|uniref:N-acetylglutamate synthase-like GNAT family acetyltransferase n=1 Tax=Murinocardiopsis flavida TaxID=645275 RepID=A0A2P8DLC5_9ACTN|nr:GNAT family N-acetyltransferase [Murinocardiopsis flavida]PSK98024.1 N-acetylglutamate synthase-like GNAT family acetyltransferase [Murinocardiopsis flavida]
MNSDDIELRRAGPADSAAVADVWLRSFNAALPTVRRARPDEQIRTWFRIMVVPAREAWVAVADGEVIAMMVLDSAILDHLYVDPPWWGRGIGGALVGVAKRRRPAGLSLWTFQVNVPSQRFYRTHGFVEAQRTDGRRNEEREPDIRFEWRPKRPNGG